jgi:Mor family transcriptional regulator
MDWLKEAREEDFPEKFHAAIEAIGLENLVKLSLAYRKDYLYFGHLDRIESEIKRRYVLKRFNGRNHSQLAKETGWSLPYIYEILREQRDERQGNLL